MMHYKTVMFVQFTECQAPLNKCKAPLKIFWWRFRWHTNLVISHLFGKKA